MGYNSGIAFLGIFGLTITILAFCSARGLEKINKKREGKSAKKEEKTCTQNIQECKT